MVTHKEFLADIDVALGGRVAEELIFGAENVTSGASSDLRNATATATRMVKARSPHWFWYGSKLTLNTTELGLFGKNRSSVSQRSGGKHLRQQARRDRGRSAEVQAHLLHGLLRPI